MNISSVLWLVPFLPMAGFLFLALFGTKIPRKMVPVIGAGTIGLAALITLIIGIDFLQTAAPGTVIEQHLWTWFSIAGFHPEMTLHLDALSLTFIFVITFVGFFIHMYSAEYMREEEGYSRFFSYMNLFVFSMLVLVLANDLLLLYLGWEGVGLCSFILIGFTYADKEKADYNAYAARKSFLITRIGDTAMILGFFLLVKSFNTLKISEILAAPPGMVKDSSRPKGRLSVLGGAHRNRTLPLRPCCQMPWQFRPR